VQSPSQPMTLILCVRPEIWGGTESIMSVLGGPPWHKHLTDNTGIIE